MSLLLYAWHLIIMQSKFFINFHLSFFLFFPSFLSLFSASGYMWTFSSFFLLFFLDPGKEVMSQGFLPVGIMLWLCFQYLFYPICVFTFSFSLSGFLYRVHLFSFAAVAYVFPLLLPRIPFAL